jgi:hypothetical protein
MWGNNIGDDGVRAVSGLLAKSGSLLSLNLGDNNVTQEGAACLAAALEFNRSLTDLNLASNRQIGWVGRCVRKCSLFLAMSCMSL